MRKIVLIFFIIIFGHFHCQDNQYFIIYLPPFYLDLILQQGKVFYLNFEKNSNPINDQSKFEEVKYQKFVTDA